MTDEQASWYRYDSGGEMLVLALHVQPGAKRTEIAGLHGGRLKIRVAAPAVEDKANRVLVGFMAARFDLPGSRVIIRSGSRWRSKTVEIHGQADPLLARAKELLHS